MAHHQMQLDPHLTSNYGPVPRWLPQRDHNSGSRSWHHHKNLQMVWPRDKKQKGAKNWSRFKDVLTGKGPDMWIANRDSYGPHRPVWTGWETPGDYDVTDRTWGNLGYMYRKDNTMLPFPGAHRDRKEKYDFKSRRYREPRIGVWSDVKWSNHEPHMALYHQDERGRQVVDPAFDNGAFNAGLTSNPFAYSHHTGDWDWRVGDWNGW